jgi:hypothetical protein
VSSTPLRATTSCLLASGVFLALTLAFPGSIPGLHHDEAWVILEARRIASGAHPLNGMNHYTGALYSYVAAPVLALAPGGDPVRTLRLLAAGLNAVALVLVMSLAARLGVSGGLRLGFGLAVATAPFFVGLSRFAVEINALNPLLLAAGAWCAVQGSPPSPLRAGLGGAFFGLAAYSHAHAMIVVAALVVSALTVFRRTWVASASFWTALAGLGVGLLPRLASWAVSADGEAVAGGRPWARLGDAVLDLASLPGVLESALDGGLVYRRFVGENAIPVLPYAVLALFALAVVRWRARGVAPRVTIERLLLRFVVSSLVLIGLVAPRWSLNYLAPSLVALVLLAFVSLARLHATGVVRPRVTAVLVALLVAMNLGYLAVSYYGRFRATGGAVSRFAVGRRVVETSDHFVRTDALYDALTRRGVRLVFADLFIAEPLRVYDLDRGAFRVLARWHPNLPLPAALAEVKAEPAAVLFYKDQFPPRTLKKLLATLATSPRRFFVADVDPHFQVWIAEDGGQASAPPQLEPAPAVHP